MGARILGGGEGDGFVTSFYSANSLAWALGDLVNLDTGANRTVKKPVDNAALFGRVVSIQGPATATSATSTILGIEVFGFNHTIELSTDAAVALGVSAQSNGTANYIETSGGSAGRNLVISDVTESDGTHTITLLV